MDQNKLIDLAWKARENAYVPYSHFKVGACIALKDGTFVQGCNIENAAYGSTMCAERNAVFGAYCKGYRKEDIIGLAIVCLLYTSRWMLNLLVVFLIVILVLVEMG